MHPTVIIRVALPKNNLAKPQHIGGACVKWIPPKTNMVAPSFLTISNSTPRISPMALNMVD